MENIRPEGFSASYRRVVENDVGPEDLKNHAENRNGETVKRTAEGKKRYRTFVDVLTRINIICDSLSVDKDVLPVNFVAVGSILLEFMSALSEHMGWADLIEDFGRNNPVSRLDKTTKGNATGTSIASDLTSFHVALAHIWQRLLTCIDREVTGTLSPQFDIEKVSAFTKSFFDNVQKSRYSFFVEEEVPVHG